MSMHRYVCCIRNFALYFNHNHVTSLLHPSAHCELGFQLVAPDTFSVFIFTQYRSYILNYGGLEAVVSDKNKFRESNPSCSALTTTRNVAKCFYLLFILEENSTFPSAPQLFVRGLFLYHSVRAVI